MPGPCVSWGFPLSLRCKLATRTAQCIGSLSCWGLRDGGEALSPGTRWGHPGPRSRERAHGVCSSAAPPSPVSMGALPPEGTAQSCVRRGPGGGRGRGGSVLEGGGHGTAPRAVGSAPHCWSSGGIRAPPSDIRFGFGFGWCCVQLELGSMTREEQLGCSVILQFFCPAKRAPWAGTAGAVLLLSQALQRKGAAM